MRHLIISVILEKLESKYSGKQLKKFLKIILSEFFFISIANSVKHEVTDSTERTFILDKELKGVNPTFLLEPKVS